ncbi:MAG: hypothetical protein KF871_10535 [Hydrogenophaga sp.]|uniref:hypothetical protein n=1 Tax=Hydrogenophaga sp. TaxID=1904254 RepID=UPI001E0A3881|nr:hypothetical protein [Hydrogenophaga sp.]MBX3610318.1 hypothetical protein [Hydrogenophaga sp.]
MNRTKIQINPQLITELKARQKSFKNELNRSSGDSTEIDGSQNQIRVVKNTSNLQSSQSELGLTTPEFESDDDSSYDHSLPKESLGGSAVKISSAHPAHKSSGLNNDTGEMDSGRIADHSNEEDETESTAKASQPPAPGASGPVEKLNAPGKGTVGGEIAPSGASPEDVKIAAKLPTTIESSTKLMVFFTSMIDLVEMLKTQYGLKDQDVASLLQIFDGARSKCQSQIASCSQKLESLTPELVAAIGLANQAIPDKLVDQKTRQITFNPKTSSPPRAPIEEQAIEKELNQIRNQADKKKLENGLKIARKIDQEPDFTTSTDEDEAEESIVDQISRNPASTSRIAVTTESSSSPESAEQQSLPKIAPVNVDSLASTFSQAHAPERLTTADEAAKKYQALTNEADKRKFLADLQREIDATNKTLQQELADLNKLKERHEQRQGQIDELEKRTESYRLLNRASIKLTVEHQNLTNLTNAQFPAKTPETKGKIKRLFAQKFQFIRPKAGSPMSKPSPTNPSALNKKGYGSSSQSSVSGPVPHGVEGDQLVSLDNDQTSESQ